MEERKIEPGVLEQLKEASKDRSKKILIVGYGHVSTGMINSLCERLEDEMGVSILPDQIEIIEEPHMTNLGEFGGKLIEELKCEVESLVENMKMCDADIPMVLNEEIIPEAPRKLKKAKGKKVPRANYGFKGKGFTNRGKNHTMRRR